MLKWILSIAWSVQRSRPHLIRHSGDFDQRRRLIAPNAGRGRTPHSSSLHARRTGRWANHPPGGRSLAASWGWSILFSATWHTAFAPNSQECARDHTVRTTAGALHGMGSDGRSTRAAVALIPKHFWRRTFRR